MNKPIITIETIVNASIKKVWKYWNSPEHIQRWNHASEDWHTTRAEVDLRKKGTFTYRMEAKDGSEGFDFKGVYTRVVLNELIEYRLEDNRTVKINFATNCDQTHIEESFEAEDQNAAELQRAGWQAILDNFKLYTETN